MSGVMKFYYTMKEIREKYEVGAEALVGRSMGDKELLEWLNNNTDATIKWDERKGKYCLEKII